MKKRFLFVAAMAALALNVYAADSDYTVDANGVITKYSGFDTEVTIPATIGGKKITAIGKEAFEKADLTSIVIPDGITEIGVDAFRDNKLTTITIPGSVKTIERGAFYDNNGISTIVLPEGVETVGSWAFSVSSRAKIISINIPASIRSWALELYEDYVSSVTIAANINLDLSMGGVFFRNYIANDRRAGTYTGDMKCEEKRADGYSYYETQYGAVLTESEWRGGTRVRIPAEIGGIPVKALYGTFDKNYGRTNQIDAVQIPESVTYIGPRTFWGQPLVSITIPTGVTYIGDEAFWRNQLASLTIPDTVVYIGAQAFFENKLTSVTIPAGVTYLGALAFAGNGIKTITIPPSVKTLGGNPLFASANNNTVNGTSIVIGADVRVIGNFLDGYERDIFKPDYDKNGRKAGRYTAAVSRSGGVTWTYSAK